MTYILKKRVLICAFYLAFILMSASCQSPYDEMACKLKSMEVKGRITRVSQEHEKVFYIDSTDQRFPLHFNFDKDSYREINEIKKGDIYMLPIAGDSIFKQAGSKYVKFKRGNKIFVESLRANDCD